MPKVLVIGLDGGTWDLIMPWIKQDKLPNFKKLVNSGTWGELTSTIPPYTVPAWNTLTSGKSPGKLGISGLIQKVPGEYDFKPFFFIVKDKRNNIWDILGSLGKRVVVANIPSTNQAWKVNGFMVAGSFMSVRPGKWSYPRDLKEQMKKDIGFYDIQTIGEIKLVDKYAEYLYKLIDRESRMFQYLLTVQPWDFGFIVFEAPDRIQHKSYDNKDFIYEIYKRIDKELVKILKVAGDDTIVIFVSDHGFGPSEYAFNVNEWLIREDLLKFKKGGKGSQSRFRKLTSRMIYEGGMKNFLSKIVSKLPKSWQTKLVHSVVPQELDESKVDWARTYAFCKPACGEIYLNVKGREAEGIIKSGKEYEKVRSGIIKNLKEIKNPNTGKRLDPQIYKQEEVFGENAFDGAPDLVIVPDDNIPTVNARIGTGKIFSKTSLPGEHRINGMFLATGPGVKKDFKFNAKIKNIAPTILHIYNVPIPKDMDGTVIYDIFEEDSELRTRKTQRKSSTEEDLIKDKVKAMVDMKKIRF
jgi:predicted AlkP superfamily phosphohydrolase/phosphomutase